MFCKTMDVNVRKVPRRLVGWLGRGGFELSVGELGTGVCMCICECVSACVCEREHIQIIFRHCESR